MDKQTLSTLLNGKLFVIPDYQRGYAWEDKQWNDLIEDIDALVTDTNIKSHYTGTVVTYTPDNCDAIYNRKPVKKVEVIDGQQRLTSVCLYLAVIIRTLIENGEKDYEQDIPEFLYHDATCKLTLNNDTEELFYQFLKEGKFRKVPETPHQKRLLDAYDYFSKHVQKQLSDSSRGIKFVIKLFEAITGKMVFTYYTIEEECEIGMTFELMNSRGKDLSVLELLKNYLMHWISRNGELDERHYLTKTVNMAWKDAYVNIGRSSASEAQCLRTTWTLYCHHLPKNWKGYEGFKQLNYIPLRDFSKKTKLETKEFLKKIVNGLATISVHYAVIVNPTADSTFNKEEFTWLSKIKNTGNIANFIPLIVAARLACEDKKISDEEYISLLMSLECYAYRVFLFEGKRSNAGKSSFYRWGKELYENSQSIVNITSWVHGLIRYYHPDADFDEWVKRPFEWYHHKQLLKYTLFEYELHLLSEEGKNKKPTLSWKDLVSESTLEHILPQNPDEKSHWTKVWKKKDIEIYLHDIGNMVLTQNNSNYLNFEFERKKGKAGISPSYSDSDIRQERKIAKYDEWDVANLKERREELELWILKRWKTEEAVVSEEINEDADADESEENI